MVVYFSLFAIVFLIKFSSLVLLLAFISRVFQLTLVNCFIIIRQGLPLGFFTVELICLQLWTC